MAFVFRAERKSEVPRAVEVVGPGSYIGHSEYKPRTSNAPFASTTTRQPQEISTNKTYTPGPGSYGVSIGFESISKSMQNVQSLKSQGVEKFGVQLIKPSNMFQSKVDRFKHEKVDKYENPGPGTYQNDNNWHKKTGKPPMADKKKINFQFNTNHPSIPSHENVFGYEETDHGVLMRQKNPEKVFAGAGQDRVGPGQYVSQSQFDRQGRGTNFHASRAKREAKGLAHSSSAAQLGPGTYNIDKGDVFPIYKYKPSSNFVSKVDRRLVPCQSQSKLQKKKRAMLNPYLGHQDDSDSEEDLAPGPGHYVNHKTNSAFQSNKIPERMQFFGSTVERFSEKARPEGGVVGPGSYSVQIESTKQLKSMKAPKVPFQTSNKRFQEAPTQVSKQVPGPGQYQEPTLVKDLTKKPWGKQGVFGSTEKRFTAKVVMNNPGPGQYKPDIAIQNLDKKKSENNIKKCSSMFLSKSNRIGQLEPRSDVKPPVGQYNQEQNTISESIKRNAETGLGNPLLSNLKAKKGAIAPFASGEQRFKDNVKGDECEQFLGPGYYEHRTFVEMEQNKPSTKAQGFLTNQNRFKAGEVVQTGVENPGPGQYNSDDVNPWSKRSYNMIFAD